MSIKAQLIATSVLQRVPAVIVKTNQRSYLFNLPEQYRRFLRKHYATHKFVSSIFFTKFDAESLAGIASTFLDFKDTGYGYGTSMYIDPSTFNYIEEMTYFLGYRTLPLSYAEILPSCKVGNNRYRVGLKEEKQFGKLVKIIKQDAYKERQSNEELIKMVETLNPLSLLHSERGDRERGSAYFSDEEIKIKYFCIKDGEKMFYNYFCEPIEKKSFYDRKLGEGLKLSSKEVQDIFKKGKVMRENGEVVTREQISSKNRPESILIMHFESLGNIDEILSNPIFLSYLEDTCKENKKIGSVIYILEPNDSLSLSQMILHDKFKLLISQFPTDTIHLLYHPHLMPQIIDQDFKIGYFQMSQIINQAYPHFMPDLNSNCPSYSQQHMAAIHQLKTEGFDIQPYRYQHQLEIFPERKKLYSKIKVDFNELSQKNSTQHCNYSNYNNHRDYNHLKNKRGQRGLKQSSSFDPQVIFLGTSSLSSSFIRNVSGILIRFFQNNNIKKLSSSILLDCGEGIYSQMINHFGARNFEEELKKVKIIFITHMHTDHCSGVMNLIVKRMKLMAKQKQDSKIYLLIPSNCISWFQSFNLHVEKMEGCQVIFIETLLEKKYQSDPEILNSKISILSNKKCFFKKKPDKEDKENKEDEVDEEDKEESFQSSSIEDASIRSVDFFSSFEKYEKMQKQNVKEFKKVLESQGIVQFSPVPVIHCPQSYGIIIKHASGEKISYSGDCRPTQKFKKAAAQSTLLIHQATFDSDNLKSSYSARHSTISEAITVGYKSKSRMTALTHFSRRIVKSHEFSNLGVSFKEPKIKFYAENKTFVSHDHLQFHLSEMGSLPSVCNYITKESYRWTW